MGNNFSKPVSGLESVHQILIDRRKQTNSYDCSLRSATALGPYFKDNIQDDAVWTHLENAAVAVFTREKVCSL